MVCQNMKCQLLVLDQIHNLDEEHYGTMSDEASYKWIAEEYKTGIYEPLELQRTTKEKRTGITGDPIPILTPEAVAKHFEEDGLYLHRELGDDIRVCKKIQKHIQFYELARKSPSGKKRLDFEKIKTWREVSKHKMDLVTKMHSLYPHIAKRQKKSAGEPIKPPGTRC